MDKTLIKTITVFTMFFLLAPVNAFAQDEICAVYFTGVGCPHCARTDPVLLGELTEDYDSLIIIEYEIYQQQVNAQFMFDYNSIYGSGLGIPLLIFGKDDFRVGDYPILDNLEGTLASKAGGSPCPLVDGSETDFSSLDISSLPGLPKIWTNGRILMKVGEGDVPSDVLRSLLLSDSISGSVSEAVNRGVKIENTTRFPVYLSGSQIEFEYALKINDAWVLQCRECPEIGPGLDEGEPSKPKTFITQSGDSTTLAAALSVFVIFIAVFFLLAKKKGVKNA